MSDKPNTIISIGYLGYKRCYLNVPREEAIQRYMKSEGDEERPSDNMIDEAQVSDEWCSYDGAGAI